MWTSSSAAQWRWTTAHISCPFMPCIGEWWWLMGKSSEGRKMCAATDESISTLKSPDCSLSFSYLPSWAKKSFKLAFTPLFFFGSIFSLSLSLFSPPLLFIFFYSSVPQGFPHRKHTNIYLFSFTRIAWPSFCCIFFVKESEWILLSLTPALHSFHNKTNL